MLDIKFIRENKDKVKKGVADKGFDPKLVDDLLILDRKYLDALKNLEELRAERNEKSQPGHIFESISKGSTRFEDLSGNASTFAPQKKIKNDIKMYAKMVDEFSKQRNTLLSEIPNLPSNNAPVGKSDKENVEIRKWGEPRKFEFAPKDHLSLGENLGILDFETGAKVTGSQFFYLYGDGARLELALVQYAFDFLEKEGFKPVITPDLAKSRYYLGTGYMPKGTEAQTYTIEGEDLGLIATAEVTLAGKHADEIIPKSELPIKYIGYSHCFRQEAGAYGKYSKGLYRVHQFTKAEMFVYCTPEESEKMHLHILEMEERICQSLGLPYRVVEMCTGDLGAMAVKKFDIEVWMPGRNDYGEVTSTSNCTDYQARNLNIKYKTKEGKNDYVHMLNGTAIVMSRFPLAILENYQEEDGSVTVPEVLRKWIGKDKIVASGK